ncbi:MAG: hypothetical protein JM58_01800 [Peptococcaceae bacterium BICA1-8]|nr:MAG: hypothetical protein JM58_01800 [Peptococcaceae bacterium BICA1-8]
MPVENNIIKAIKLLDFFTTDRPNLGLNELVRLSSYPKGTVHRLLTSLEDCGLVCRCHEYNDDRRYRLGIKIFELGMRVYQNFDLSNAALPIMKELKAEINEAIHLTIRIENEAMYFEKIDTDHPVRLYTKKGRRTPLYAGASGRILLTYLSDEKIHDYLLNHPIEQFTPNTPATIENIWDKIKTTRAHGYTLSMEELCPDSWEIAIPVFNSLESVVASLSIAGPMSRYTQDLIIHYIPKLKRSAELLSQQIGSLSSFSA